MSATPTGSGSRGGGRDGVEPSGRRWPRSGSASHRRPPGRAGAAAPARRRRTPPASRPPRPRRSRGSTRPAGSNDRCGRDERVECRHVAASRQADEQLIRRSGETLPRGDRTHGDPRSPTILRPMARRLTSRCRRSLVGLQPIPQTRPSVAASGLIDRARRRPRRRHGRRIRGATDEEFEPTTCLRRPARSGDRRARLRYEHDHVARSRQLDRTDHRRGAVRSRRRRIACGEHDVGSGFPLWAGLGDVAFQSHGDPPARWPGRRHRWVRRPRRERPSRDPRSRERCFRPGRSPGESKVLPYGHAPGRTGASSSSAAART